MPNDEYEFEDIDLPASLLNRMRAEAEARGERRVNAQGLARQRARAKEALEGRNHRAERRKRLGEMDSYYGRDPQGLGTIFSHLLAERGWSQPVAVGGVLSRWRELVGSAIADHAEVESFENGVVSVRADSTAWATHLRIMAPQLIDQLNERLGAGVIARLEVRGPAAPSWVKGRRTVRGRGPRDTYG